MSELRRDAGRISSLPVPARAVHVDSMDSVRLDKWLWAVRLFKTRTLAADEIKAGHVRLNGQTLKPAREVRIGEIYTVQKGAVTRTVKVTGLLENRVGAPLVSQYMEDLTTPEELAKRSQEASAPRRPAGWGRPTKKDRRQIDSAFGQE